MRYLYNITEYFTPKTVSKNKKENMYYLPILERKY